MIETRYGPGYGRAIKAIFRGDKRFGAIAQQELINRQKTSGGNGLANRRFQIWVSPWSQFTVACNGCGFYLGPNTRRQIADLKIYPSILCFMA
jgi:hypothetical protein